MPRGGEYSEDELQVRKDQLDLVMQVADSALTSQDSRDASVNSRAGLLTGAAAILASVQVTTTSSAWVYVLLVASLLAALCGLYVVRPRWDAILEPDVIREDTLERSPLQAKDSLIEDKLAMFKKRETGLATRAKVVLVGYGFLTLSVIAELIIAISPVATKSGG